MSEKIARLGIERDNDMMYYIKGGDVWATPRKQPGKPKGKAQKIAATGIDLDYSRYLYFLDSDGDVARKARALGGGRRSKTKAKAKNGNGAAASSRSAISGHFVTKATAKRHPKLTVTEMVGGRSKKSPAQLQREIDECLAGKTGGNGNGGNGAKNGNGGNGTKSAGKSKKKSASGGTRHAKKKKSASGGAHQKWNIYSGGKLIDSVFYVPSADADYVRRGLIDHDGYPSDIRVRRAR